MKGRNIERRRRREFSKLVSEHPILLILYKNDEIMKHSPEIESVLWDFYMAGVFDTLKLTVVAMDEPIKRAESRE